jgi:hypothetical protein
MEWIIKKLQEKNDKYKIIEESKNKVIEEIKLFLYNNKTEIKKLLPKKNEVYKVINLDSFSSWCLERIEDKEIFFKSIDERFTPIYDLCRIDSEGFNITVRGQIVDCNNRIILEDIRVPITSIIKSEIDVSLKLKHTFIYLMIDKNTGLYKIGRSNKPYCREKTLQSEKPTIELLFFYNGISSDENIIHKIFSEKRVRGEWFNLNANDILTFKQYFNDGMETTL